MRTVTTIGGEAVCALLGMPDSESVRLPSALWFPAELDDEILVISALAASWRSDAWFGLETFVARDGSPARSGDIDDRRGVVAEGTVRSPRGLTARSLWRTLDPGSPAVPGCFAAARRSRGKGSCLALTPPAQGPRAWYAASTALLHRALLAVEAPGEMDVSVANRSAVLTYLAATTSGFAAVVPLDAHPWGGCVVIASVETLARLAGLLPASLDGVVDVSWEEVVGRGGGLAL